MALDQHTSNLVDVTVKAFNGDVTSLSPTDGISLIDSWLSFLKSGDQSDDSVTQGLSDLKAELQRGNLDGATIQRLLKDLSEQTKQLTDSVETDNKSKMTTLSEALRGFSRQVNGESGPAKTGGQAPMTSTVGGESTNSGTGASSLGAPEDDLSGRNGGTISSDPTVDMDDTTGSDGGAAQDHSSGDAEDTGDASYSSESNESRSDTARVGGMGISGGTGDTDYTQSGGRSQY